MCFFLFLVSSVLTWLLATQFTDQMPAIAVNIFIRVPVAIIRPLFICNGQNIFIKHFNGCPSIQNGKQITR